MSLEQQVASLVTAANGLTAEVAGKMGQINAVLDAKRQELTQWQAAARGEWPFINLLKNAHMLKQDAQGNFIELPFVLGGGIAAFEVVTPTTPNVPLEVTQWFRDGLIVGHGHLLRVTFAEAPPSGIRYWMSSNSVVGQFSGGFKFVHVQAGRVRDIQAGQTGTILDVLPYRNWHIDLMLGDVANGTVAYFGMPFVVAGTPSEVRQVRTINYQDSKLLFI